MIGDAHDRQLGITRRRTIACLVIIAASFVLTVFVLPALPLRGDLPPRIQWMPTFEVPDADSFFVYSVGDELSHAVLLHDFGESIENAREADILFLGNSRMPLGLREESIVPEAEQLGLRVFSLAAGHGERVQFALELIRRHDLRPKVVVAVGGPDYFTSGLSKHATHVASLTRWQAWKAWVEAQGKWRFQRAVHSWLPRIDWHGQKLASNWIIYRSGRTGWWRPAREPSGSYPVAMAREDDNYERLLPAARLLAEELDARGTLLVLGTVPHKATRSGHLPVLSDALGVPAVLPSFDDVETSDGSHLDRESAARYSQAFWEAFVALPAVRERLAIAPARDEGVPNGAGRLQATRRAITRLRVMLEEYYGGPGVLRQTWYLQPDDPRYQRGIGFLADKLARALVWSDRFVIGTIGSSVVAGFDNCHFDTYQKQLERLMAPVWASAGVAFEVRNSGQGGSCGDSFDNQVWCLRTLVGDDVDMTHYSWTYFEAGRKAEELQRYHELFYRWSLLMERSPVPQLLYTGDCTALSKRDQRLLDVYGPFGADVLCMQRGIRTVGYAGKVKGAVGDSLHTTTRYGESADVSEERRRSLGVVFRNWHPGPLLFQTTADALAYKLTDAMLLALDRIAAEPYPHVRWPKLPRLLGLDALPTPLACPEEWCSVPEAPRCLDYEKPTFGEQHFRALETRGGEDPAIAGWKQWQGRSSVRYVPEGERQLPECAHPARCAGLIAPASEAAGWLTFTLPKLRLGYIAICCSRKKCGQFMLDAGTEFRLNGKAPTVPPEAIGSSKCVQVQPRFQESHTGRSRTVDLGIRIPAREQPIPAITHVIGL